MRCDKNVYYLVCFFIFLIKGTEVVYAQIHTAGFPLAIGNKWFYRYDSRYSPFPYVLVKAIIDTTRDGARIVRVSKLNQDSVTVGMETWIVHNGSFYLGSIHSLPIYNFLLTKDTTWSAYGTEIDTYTYRLVTATLFGETRKGQVFSERRLVITSLESYEEFHVALGIGPYYKYSWGYAQSYGHDNTSKLIGILINGKFIGDTVLTSVGNITATAPKDFNLNQNYPNPFSPGTTIRYTIPQNAYVALKVYSLLGEEIETLVSKYQMAGEHEIAWRPVGLPNGVYIFRLQAKEFLATKKLILLR